MPATQVLPETFARHASSLDPTTLNTTLADLRAIMHKTNPGDPIEASLSYFPFY